MKKISFVLALAIIASCSPMKAPQGTAMFDFFTYEGVDSTIAAINLPSDDCAYNPLIQGYYPDPSICSDGQGNYYIVTTTASYYPGVPVFHSTDLLNWEQIGHVLDRPSQFASMSAERISEGVYSPDIKYNPSDKNFYMITTDLMNGFFYVKTTDPAGDWSEPVYIQGLGGVDPSFFFDEDGTAYIVFDSVAPENRPEYNGHRTIRIVKYDLQNDQLASDIKIIVNKGADPESNPFWLQGPHMYKVDGKYVLICTQGASKGIQAETAFSSDDPMGTFTAASQNPILTQVGLPADRNYPVTNTGHADLVKAADGNWWAVFTGSRPNSNGFDITGRETYMLPVTWAQDGCPVILAQGEAVPSIVKHDGAKRTELLTSPSTSYRDDFDGETLDGRWMTLRSDASDLYSLDKGGLALTYSENSASSAATPAAVFTRILQPSFEATTRVYQSPILSLDKAGILLLKDERHQYFLAASEFSIDLFKVETVLEMTEGRGAQLVDDTKSIAHKMLKDCNFIDLKVISDGRMFSFWYAVNGKDWTKLGDDQEAKFLSTANAGGFTAPVIGLYAVQN